MNTAISLDKNNYDMYLNCYYCLADMGQEDLGIKYLQDALIIDEKANASHKSRGAVNFLLGDYTAALTQFEYAGETDDVETLIYIGLCHQSLGDTTKSYEAFSKALANGGENAEVYYQMGMCMFSTGDYDKALSHLQNGLALGGGQHKQEMMYTLGLCHERQLDYKAALKAFEDYVALYGSNEELDKEIAFLRTR
jgi:tetratricopeptide (TPR) repeat protein